MPTEAQINANRPNAQKSTGPKTPEGKAASSLNALKSGIDQVECLDKTLTQAEFLDAQIQHNSPLGHAFHAALEPFSRLNRRIDATNRMFLRTLKALQDLQAAAISEPPSPTSQPVAPQIGFVPQTAPEYVDPPRLTHETLAAPPEIPRADPAQPAGLAHYPGHSPARARSRPLYL